jgi:uncharacterized protein YneF (UPF0154 family)
MGDQLLQSPPISSTAIRQEKPNRPRRTLYVALIACVVLLLVGFGVFVVPRLFSQQNANNSPVSVVGHITFLASPNAARNTYDQLQISLTSVSTPPAGKTYYAWLENSVSDASQIQHWPLQFTNGSIQGTYQSNPLHTDLLSNNTLFLITAEDSGTPPTIPSPNLNTHLYYAVIAHSTSLTPTYEVKGCPSSGTNCV